MNENSAKKRGRKHRFCHIFYNLLELNSHEYHCNSGSAFFPNKQGYRAMRLSFSKPSESEIDLGISILGKLLKNYSSSHLHTAGGKEMALLCSF